MNSDYNATVNHYLRAAGVNPVVADKRPTVSGELAAAIKKGWKATWKFLFDDPKFRIEKLARHHRRAIKWHWNARHRVARGQKTKYYAYFPIFSRGHAKSSVARRIAVMDAILSVYYGVGGYCLYFSGTQLKIDGHAKSISGLLTSGVIAKHAPALAKVKRSTEGSRSLGWKADFIYTSADYVFHFGSLESGLAGANIDDIRPTLMVPDDIDNRKLSAVIAKKNLETFTTEILPMGSTGTLTFFAQNLINRYSVMYQIHKGFARVLTNRMPAKPIPALINPKFEVRTINGIVKDVITGGTPTWAEVMDIQGCQEELDRIGLPAFMKECQHELDSDKIGLIFKNYDDLVHVISESEFASVYGSKDAWKKFYKWSLNDYARTKTKYHANVSAYFSISNQNSKLPGFRFIIPFSFVAESTAQDVAERMLDALRPWAYIDRNTGEKITWTQLRKQTISREGIEFHAKTEQQEHQLKRAALARVVPLYSRPLLEDCRVIGGAMSHSESTVREIYNDCYGFNFEPSNPGMYDGVDDLIQDAAVDYNMPHPFRPEQMGYTRWFIIAPDDTAQEPVEINGIMVYPPKPFPDDIIPDNLHDSDLMRFQFSNWRAKPPKITENGEQIDIIEKLNDDYGQMLQMFYFKNLLFNLELTEEEKRELTLPRHLRKEVIEEEAATLSPDEIAARQIKRELVLNFENPLRNGNLRQNETKREFWGDKFR